MLEIYVEMDRARTGGDKIELIYYSGVPQDVPLGVQKLELACSQGGVQLKVTHFKQLRADKS